MKRLLRRGRRTGRGILNKLFPTEKPVSTSAGKSLELEALEPRVLLTTLTLPAGTLGSTVFVYADPQDTTPGDAPDQFNELRITTLSGLPPTRDVVVEVLNFEGNDIPGAVIVGDFGVPVDILGGPGGILVFEEIGDMDGDNNDLGMGALATDSLGNTYGIGETGDFYSINTTTAQATFIGQIQDALDTDGNPRGVGNEITFTAFEAASFDPVSGLLYAVVVEPDLGSVLVTIDLDTAEADPVGRDAGGQHDYASSLIAGADDPNTEGIDEGGDIRTIVYRMEEGVNDLNDGTNPTFLVFDAVSNQFRDVLVEPNGLAVTVTPLIVTQTNDDAQVEGLMYGHDVDGTLHLFGINDQGDTDQLVEVILGAADPGDVLVDIFEAPEDSVLEGMSYDFVNDWGYASDANSGTLYRINTITFGPDPDDDGNLVVVGGGSDIYLMYIASSTPDVLITLTSFTIDSDGNVVYSPGDGTGAYLFTDDDNNDIETPGDAGGVMIGTVPVLLDPDNDELSWRPTTFFDSNEVFAENPGQHGKFPGGYARPGIVLAADEFGQPQQIGQIQVDGGVFGDVVINGSIGTFYAGYLATNRFVVEGNMQTLAVRTQAGGIEESDGTWTSVGSGFLGLNSDSPIVNVRGSLGSFYSNDDWGLPIRVQGLTEVESFAGVLDSQLSLPGQPQVFARGVREIERKIDDDDDTILFPFGAFDTDGATDYIFTNDSPYLAQYVGSVDGTVRVFGTQEGDFDGEDFYSFGVMAGQTITIDLFNTGLLLVNPATGLPLDPNSEIPLGLTVFSTLDLFDPDLNWIGNLAETDPVTGQPIPLTFTAEKAGIYTVSINGQTADFAQTTGLTYRLDITGLSKTTLGGGNVVAEIRQDQFDVLALLNAPEPILQIVHGNAGAISAGERIRAAAFIVDQGDLIALRAGANGLDLNDVADREIVTGDVPGPPNVSETGFGLEVADNGAHINTIYLSGTNVINSYPRVVAGGNVGRISSPLRSAVDIFVGGNLQSVQIGSVPEALGTTVDSLADFTGPGEDDGTDEVDLLARIIVDGNIGQIIIEDDLRLVDFQAQGEDGFRGFGSTSMIFANADGIGSPGVIDAIIIGGALEGPISVGPSGGNVRFVEIGGTIRHPSVDGAVESSFGPFSFNPGQSATITDDSGVLIRISPGFVAGTVDEFFFGPAQAPPPPPDPDIPVVEPGGVITVKVVPILDKTFDEYLLAVDRTEVGFALAGVFSTDGVRIKSQGGPVEIGLVRALGLNDNSVIISGSNPVSVLRLAAEAPVTVDPTTPGAPAAGITGITEIINNSGGDMVAIQIGEVTEVRNVSVGDSGDDGDNITLITVELALIDGIYPVELIRINGDLGRTPSTTGQVISASLISVRPDEGYDTQLVDPGGNQFVGLYSAVAINRIVVDGALGDVDVRGNVGSITINADHHSDAGQFDGVIGPIIVYANIAGRVELGDGVPSPSTGFYAQSGVFAYGSINRVTISGNGHTIGGPIFVVTDLSRVDVTNGATITGYNTVGLFGSERITGSPYASPTIAAFSSFSNYFVEDNTFAGIGSIGAINVKGRDSEIRNATLLAGSFNSIRVTGGANGVFGSEIRAFGSAGPDVGVINQFVVGGQGIHDTIIDVRRELGRLVIQPGGTLEDSEIRSQFEIGSIQVDQINHVDIDAINAIGKVRLREGAFDLVVETGALGTFSTRDSVLGSGIFVAGPVGNISTRGDFISTLHVTGPFGNLKNLKASGDIGTPTGGEITVDGKVGNIIAGGDFNAELLLNWIPDPVSPANPLGPRTKFKFDGFELGKLSAKGQVNISGDIGGDIKKILSSADFGFAGDDLRIHGGLDQLVIGSKKQRGDLETNLIVDESIGKMTIYGDSKGTIDVIGDFNLLSLIGAPNNTVMIEENITVGEEFGQIKIVNGGIESDVQIVSGGDGPKFNIKGQGSQAPLLVQSPAEPLGVDGLDIDGVNIFKGDAGGFVIDGNFLGQYLVGGNSGRIELSGDIAEDALIVIGGNLDALIVEGNIYGTVIVLGSIGQVEAGNIIGKPDDVLADLITAGIVTAGKNIGSLKVSGEVTNTYVMAGFNPGLVSSITGGVFDPEELRIDGTDDDPNEGPRRGNIDSAKIGELNNAFIAAGVGPGSNRILGDMDGSDVAAPGISSIGKIDIEETAGEGTPFGVFADSQIKQLRIGGEKVTSLPVMGDDGFVAGLIAADAPGSVVDPNDTVRNKEPVGVTFLIGADLVHVTITLSGPGEGLVEWEAGSFNALQLTGTTEKTRLKIIADGDDTINVGTLFTDDDATLKSLQLDGMITELLTLGGPVKLVQLAGASAGSVLTFEDTIKRADMGEVSGTVQFNGVVTQLQTDRVMAGATLSAPQIDRYTANDSFNGTLLVTETGIGKALVKGDMSGVISSRDYILQIIVTGLTGGDGPRPIQGIRAGGMIGQFTTGRMSKAVVAAGKDFLKATIKDDFAYSTLAAGLDIGEDGLLNDLDPENMANDTPGRGNLRKVLIKGDFIQSNLVAGLNGGSDQTFGTGDDELPARTVDEVDAPRIVEVSFPDLFTIEIKFQSGSKGPVSDIEQVRINGFVVGSPAPSEEQFAIVASGQVDRVIARRQIFRGQGNVLLQEVDTRGLLASSIVNENINSQDEAEAAAIQIWADGFNQQFEAGAGDDFIIFGENENLDGFDDDPTVFITFDEATNTAAFHNLNGFTTEPLGTNYYRILVDGTQVVSRRGISLDGEYMGSFPTGDGVPDTEKNAFEFFFAVADVGGSAISAFSPFAGAFPLNQWWTTSGELGDDPTSASTAQFDTDFFRINDIKSGQVLSTVLQDRTGNRGSSTNFDMRIWEVEESIVAGGSFSVPDHILEELTITRDTVIYETADGFLAFPPTPEEDPDFVLPGGFEYDAIGLDVDLETFVVIDTTTSDSAPFMIEDPDTGDPVPLTVTLLSDIYNGIDPDVTIQSVRGLEFGRGDVLWVVASVTDDGEERDSILQIDNITRPQDGMELASNALALAGSAEDAEVLELAYGIVEPGFGGVDEVNLAVNDRLFGIDRATNTLILIDSSPTTRNVNNEKIVNPNYGAVSVLGSRLGNLGDPDEFELTGMDFDNLGRLFAVENNSDSLVRLDTSLAVSTNAMRMTLEQHLPEGDYQALAFDPDPLSFLPGLLAETVGGESSLVELGVDSLLLLVGESFGFGGGDLISSFQVPDDGDYLIEISQLSQTDSQSITYDLHVMAFDDGNSDFGVDETPSGYLYVPAVPGNQAINLGPLANDPLTDDFVVDDDNPLLFFSNPDNMEHGEDYAAWPFQASGELLVPGAGGQIIIDAGLNITGDVDVYTLRLVEGQRITVDVDADTLFGRDMDFEVVAGIYNGDLETITTTLTDPLDVESAAQLADPFLQAQAINEMLNHPGVIIDPMELNGDNELEGVYYVVISAFNLNFFGLTTDQEVPYRLTITTTESEVVETPPSQLVWLSFNGFEAEFLADKYLFNPSLVHRPSFDEKIFDLDGRRTALIQAIKARIEQLYFETGLDVVGLDDNGMPDLTETVGEIQFVLDRPAPGTIYSTISFGGSDGGNGFYGLAENVDRDNADQTDSVVVTTDLIGRSLRPIMSNDPGQRFDEVANALSYVGAHELGHILGLEHVVDVQFPTVINVMRMGGIGFPADIFNDEVHFSTRAYDLQNQFLGFANSVDMLLRVLGTGTSLGE